MDTTTVNGLVDIALEMKTTFGGNAVSVNKVHTSPDEGLLTESKAFSPAQANKQSDQNGAGSKVTLDLEI